MITKEHVIGAHQIALILLSMGMALVSLIGSLTAGVQRIHAILNNL